MNAAMTRRYPMALALITAGSLLSAAPLAVGRDDDDKDRDARRFSADLSGYHEVHFVAGNGTPQGLPALRGAISTKAKGSFRAFIDDANNRILYELEYSGLESPVTQSHIHFGQKSVTGPISVFLCTNLGNGPAGTQPCPAPPATISGTITAVDVTNLANERGISAGEFDELLKAIRAGATYVNVHSTRWPGGEIRSQINGNSGDEKH